MNIRNAHREVTSPLREAGMKKSQKICGEGEKEQKCRRNGEGKKRCRSKNKQTIGKHFYQSAQGTFDKKEEKQKGSKKWKNKKEIFEFNQMEIMQSKEFKELCTLQNQYRKSLKSKKQEIKWLVPPQQLHPHSFSTFPDHVKEEDFEDINNLMINFLHFVCKRRIVKDEDFNYIYEGMVIKFPRKEEEIKRILIQILNVLES